MNMLAEFIKRAQAQVLWQDLAGLAVTEWSRVR